MASVNKVPVILRLIRLPNLFIVALTQVLLFYRILLPAFQKQQLSPTLDHFQFGLLSIVTVIIAAAGYVINDLYDQEIDRINKPEKQLIGPRLRAKVAWYLFYGLIGLGGLIALYLALAIDKWWQFLIYPIAVAGMWWYAARLKRTPLWGNLFVSFFCAAVAGILLFAERAPLQKLFASAEPATDLLAWVFGAYMVFAFFSTLFRELVKDLEDMEGDQKLGCRTFPVVFGIHRTKLLAGATAILLLITLLLFFYQLWDQYNEITRPVLWLGLFFPVFLALDRLRKARDKSDFHRLSTLAKLIILSGILLILFI